MALILGQILVVMLVTMIGFAAAKSGVISSAVKVGLTRITLQISVPCAIIAAGNLSVSGSAWLRVAYVMIISAVFHLGLFFVMKHWGRRLMARPGKGKISVLAVTFGNVMFVGFPIMKGLYGDDGLFLASIFTIFFNLVFYTLGSRLLGPAKGASLGSILLTPFNLSLAVMFVLLITQYKLPGPLYQTVSMMGGTCTPLSLLVIGSMMADADIGAAFRDRSLFLISFLRLIAAPLIMLLAMLFLPLDTALRRTMVALAAMPGAAMTAMLAEEFDCEPIFGSMSVVQSTILFIGTFPLIMWLAQLLIR